VLDRKSNNYLASIHFTDKEIGISFLDLSTGEFLATQVSSDYITRLVQRFAPAEIIYSKAAKRRYSDLFQTNYHHHALEEWVYQHTYTYERLNTHFGTTTLKGFGIEKLREGTVAAGAILQYLEASHYRNLHHINAIARLDEAQYVWLDRFTIRNLELLAPQHDEGVALIDILDQTLTAMGARLLRRWILIPLKEVATINERLDIVATLTEGEELLANLHQHLRQLSDLERLAGKLAVQRINPREFYSLQKTLTHTQPILAALQAHGHPALLQLIKQFCPCDHLLQKLAETLCDDPALTSSQGQVIRDGVDPALDELRALATQGQDYLLQLQAREREKTGITSLKVGYNKVFGYYLSVTHVHKDKVPSGWIRKQTLVGAERYITEELKLYEEKILHAEEQRITLEQQHYQKLIRDATPFVPQLQCNAKLLAAIDCYCSFAQQALTHSYSRPIIDEGGAITLTAARHPVIEQALPPDKKYIPNNIHLDQDSHQILLITGPNMAGKSALLRLTAITVLMAQIGSFVPAEEAHIGVIDKIFTLVGASDNLARQESTFMVEMNEMANIIHNLSGRSLVIVDELGRGTGTADGLSLAQSTLEYIHNHPRFRAKMLFSTHYHELNSLAGKLSRLQNFNIAVKELNGKIFFLHQLKPGGTPHSFGIAVAKMAGMPHPLIARAQELLDNFQEATPTTGKGRTVKKPTYQLTLFKPDEQAQALQQALQQLDLNNMTPMQAFVQLEKLQGLIKT
jgi:DNA mismatch repair protein MutS